MLKAARAQSGTVTEIWLKDHHNMWEDLMIPHLKVKKFRNNKARFPLYDALGEVYDGHLAKGNYNFTSRGFPEDEPQKQILVDAEDDMQILVDDNEDEEVHGEDPNVQLMEDDDVEVVETRQDSVPREKEANVQHTRQQRRRVSVATEHDKKEEKESKKTKKSNNVEEMMERYLELRTKQVEQKNLYF
ncbi:hypothetical protein QOZ80_8AG0627220 [Eleusine coracana subsp. coracana]|nr:hypothetical protein QOZ80_8AG0627220 [Eleusine coracana subsp. coracana]